MLMLFQISVIFKIIAMFMGLLLAIVKKRHFGWLIFAAFLIDSFMHLATIFPIVLPMDMVFFLTFVMAGTFLLATWRIYLRF